MINEYDSTALLALPRIKEGVSPERGLLISSRPFMINAIRDKGVDVVVSRGMKAFDVDNNEISNAYHPEYSKDNSEVTLRDLGRTCLNNFGVIRSIIGTVEPMNSSATFLNPNSVRRLSRNKILTAKSVLDPAGVYGREYTDLDINDHADIDGRIDSIPGNEVVAKPVSGSRSEGIIVGSKDLVSNILKSSTGKYIVEEKLSFEVPIPSLCGINTDEANRLKQANKEAVNRELRLYYFGNNTWDAVVRIGSAGENHLGHDSWLYVDLASIPDNLIMRSADVVSNIQNLVSERDREFHIAIDWVYGNCASDKYPNWKVMEINAGEPQLVQVDENKEIGKRHHSKLAEQIARVALSKR